MKVLIVNNMAPFIWGGAEELAAHLQKNLIISGHEAEILRIPFQWEPATRIPSQMLMVRAFELWNVDHVIALKFPAYLIRHTRKTLWLVHQYRQAYDLFDIGHTNLPQGDKGLELKKLIRNADNESFTESRRIYTISEVIKQRLLKYNGFDSTVLIPPVNDGELFIGGEPGNYIFAGGRVNDMKRQHMLIEAMKYTDNNTKLVIAGPPDSQRDADTLKKLVEKYDISDRVKLDLKFLPRKTYAEYINKAAAVAYLPFDEDCMGYVAVESATAAKALITTNDSGGVLSLVKHLETGWIANPDPKSIAEVINAAFKNISTTKRYGQAAQALWSGFSINWAQTVETLLK